MQQVTLRKGRDTRLAAGHLWVFANEIDGDVAALEPGGAVEVRSADGRWLGRGYANPRSLITVRLLTRERADDIDDVGFYERRLRAAVALRERVLPGRRALRVVASEADGLPGITIDRYEDVVAVQVGTLGVEKRLDVIEAAVQSVLAPSGAMLRNESNTRLLEGLDQYARPWFGEVPERVQFALGSAQWVADVRGGQKTGFFLDQEDNRAFMQGRARGSVLDLFANSGAWSVGALVAGAESAVAVDISPLVCGLIEENAALNGVSEKIQIVCDDARTSVAALGRAGRRFDNVVLDPPAFAKSRKKAGKALRAYRTINEDALALVAPGGMFYTSSCSYHVAEERFFGEVISAGQRAGRRLRLVRRGGQAPDHPVDPAIPETSYLKHFAFYVD